MKYVTLPGADNHLYFRSINRIAVLRPESPAGTDRLPSIKRNWSKTTITVLPINGPHLSADKAWEPFFTPLDEMPTEPFTDDLSRCSVQELFYYSENDVPKAKQLLAEAGYPTVSNARFFEQCDRYRFPVNC
jgi:ABC-type transport system substrate-binding protein